ncbi:hypothetical protein OTU49_017494, partial [Cherax quadricarinatus]
MEPPLLQCTPGAPSYSVTDPELPECRLRQMVVSRPVPQVKERNYPEGYIPFFFPFNSEPVIIDEIGKSRPRTKLPPLSTLPAKQQVVRRPSPVQQVVKEPAPVQQVKEPSPVQQVVKEPSPVQQVVKEPAPVQQVVKEPA